MKPTRRDIVKTPLIGAIPRALFAAEEAAVQRLIATGMPREAAVFFAQLERELADYEAVRPLLEEGMRLL